MLSASVLYIYIMVSSFLSAETFSNKMKNENVEFTEHFFYIHDFVHNEFAFSWSVWGRIILAFRKM